MKARKRGKKKQSAAREAFIRGFVATSLLNGTDGGGDKSSQDSLRRALRGGFAIASGTLVAEKLSRRDYTKALAALAAGTVCLAFVDRYLTGSKFDGEDRRDGEEEVQQVQG